MIRPRPFEILTKLLLQALYHVSSNRFLIKILVLTSSCSRLSAFLAQITGDTKYKEAAILSATWMKNLQVNANNIVLDSVNGHDCSRSPDTWLFTYNSGKYIEGLSILSAVTGDSSWTDLMITILAAAVKSSAWQGSDGIITEGASPDSNNDGVGFKGMY